MMSYDEMAAECVRLRTVNAELLAALKLFMNDPRFQVSIGGNPIMIDRMIVQVRAAIAKAEQDR